MQRKKERAEYQSFEKTLEALVTPKELFQIKMAYFIAENSHRFQKRLEIDQITGEHLPAFTHPRRAAKILIDEIQCVEPNIIIATLLHDVVEDSFIVTAGMLDFLFPSDSIRWVRAVTKNPKEGYIERLRTLAEWQALLVKLVDRLDNLRTLDAGSLQFQLEQTGETRIEYLPMFSDLPLKVPPLYRPGIERCLQEMETIVSTHESKLSTN